MIPSTASKRARTAAALDYLARRFPAAFHTDPAAVQPLAVGVREQLTTRVAADPEADAPAVLWALRRWCLSRAYVEAVAAGRPRVDLDGQPVEVPAVEHQAQARARLDTEGTATAARAKRREQAERAKVKAKTKAKGAQAGQGTAGKSATHPAPAAADRRPAAPSSGARGPGTPGNPAPAATVATRTRAGRLPGFPAGERPNPDAPAPNTPPARPLLGLGKRRPKPAE